MIGGGLGHPYEFDTLPAEHVYALDLGLNFASALVAAMAAPVEITRPKFVPTPMPVGMGQFYGTVYAYRGGVRYEPATRLTKAQRKAARRAERAERRAVLAAEREFALRDAAERARTAGGPLLGSRSMRGCADTADPFVVLPGDKRPKWLLGGSYGDYPHDGREAGE